MKDYPKSRLISAKTRAEIIKDWYPEDKFVSQITQRIIEDISAVIVFEEMEMNSEVSKEASVQKRQAI